MHFHGGKGGGGGKARTTSASFFAKSPASSIKRRASFNYSRGFCARPLLCLLLAKLSVCLCVSPNSAHTSFLSASACDAA